MKLLYSFEAHDFSSQTLSRTKLTGIVSVKKASTKKKESVEISEDQAAVMIQKGIPISSYREESYRSCSSNNFSYYLLKITFESCMNINVLF